MNRKSLQIAVHPNKSVVIKAPISSSIQAIAERIRKKTRWIKRQIACFKQFDPRTPERKYIRSESHFYLGQQYRLEIEKYKLDKIILKNGCFYIECINDAPSHIKNIMEDWYKRQAKRYLSKVVNNCWDRFTKDNLKKLKL